MSAQNTGRKTKGRLRFPEGGTGPSRTTQGPPRKHEFDCPVCGGYRKLDATRKLDRHGVERWFVGCWRAGCAANDLAVLAEAVGAPSGGELLEDPPRWLGSVLGGTQREARPRAPVPSWGQVLGWSERLMASREPLAYLRRRGLRPHFVKGRAIGWNGREFAVPIIEADAILNLYRRPLNGQFYGLRGIRAQLYPEPPAGRSLLLGAGIFDALLTRQAGLPAVTTTCGTSLPEELLMQLRPKGRRIAIVYDCGEEATAEGNAERLRAAGARAWVVRLGLTLGEDLTDFFVKYGRSADDLLRLVRQERGRADD